MKRCYNWISRSLSTRASSTEVVRPQFVKRADDFDELAHGLLPKLRKYTLENGMPGSTKVMTGASPEKLNSIFQLPAAASEKQGSSIPAILDDIDNVLEYSVRTQHPRFFKQLFAGTEPIGQVGELLAAVCNTASHVYDVAPVFNVMEVQLRQRITDMLGWDSEQADGVMMNGGVMSLVTAMVTARHWKFPHMRKEGIQAGDKPVVFTSTQAHYGVSRACMMGGMGMDACIAVTADDNGCMVPSALREAVNTAIADGSTPFFVSATSGTTVLGGYDPLVALKSVCEDNGMWLHVDGAWGGAVMFSGQKERRALLDGIQHVDSFNLNFHKALGLPQVCSFLVTNQRKGALENSNACGASYLFQNESGHDLGDKTLQCGRKPDALKLWLFWKRYGPEAMGETIDTAFDNTIYMASKIREEPEKFILVHDPMSANVCFWYVPEAFRESIVNKDGVQQNYDIVDKIQRLIRDRVQQEGNVFVQANPLKDLNYPHFFRQIFIQNTTEKEDIDCLLSEIDRFGKDITLDDLDDM